MNEPRRRILWTGGFDSTYLVVDALLTGHAVEAIVWRGWGMAPGWTKVDNEDEARRRITHALPPDLRARVREHVETDYTRAYPAVLAAYEELVAMGGWFSPQNQILAALPSLVGPVEAAFVRDDTVRPKHVAFLERAGLRLPVLAATKADLLVDAKAHGFAHLLTMTWSCEGTGRGHEWAAPCGECEPCQHRPKMADSP